MDSNLLTIAMLVPVVLTVLGTALFAGLVYWSLQ